MTEISLDLRKLADALPREIEALAKTDPAKAADACAACFKLVRQGAVSLLLVVCAAATISEHKALGNAIRGAFNSIENISTFEGWGLKASFTKPANDETLAEIYKDRLLDEKSKDGVFTAATNISRDAFERLMHVDEPRGSCFYPDGDAETRRYFFTDVQLEKLTLVELRSNAKLFAEHASGGPNDNGDPSYCYTMTLTPLGRDLKSVFVKRIAKIIPEASTLQRPVTGPASPKPSGQKQAMVQQRPE